MDSDSKSKIFSIAYNTEAEYFNELINIESHNDYAAFGNKFTSKTLKFNIENRTQSGWKIIGIRESYRNAWALAMSYLKFHFKESPEILESLDFFVHTEDPVKIPILGIKLHY